MDESLATNEFTVSPNPCSGLLDLRFIIDEPGTVTCDLYELSGVKIKSFVNDILPPGRYGITVNIEDLKPGVCFCVLMTNTGKTTRKVIKR